MQVGDLVRGTEGINSMGMGVVVGFREIPTWEGRKPIKRVIVHLMGMFQGEDGTMVGNGCSDRRMETAPWLWEVVASRQQN